MLSSRQLEKRASSSVTQERLFGEQWHSIIDFKEGEKEEDAALSCESEAIRVMSQSAAEWSRTFRDFPRRVKDEAKERRAYKCDAVRNEMGSDCYENFSMK